MRNLDEKFVDDLPFRVAFDLNGEVEVTNNLRKLHIYFSASHKMVTKTDDEVWLCS